MTTVETFANAFATTLNGGINNSVTSVTLASITANPGASSSATPPTIWRAIIDGDTPNANTEIVWVTDSGSNPVTVTRAAESYPGGCAQGSPVSHLSGVPFRAIATAETFTTLAYDYVGSGSPEGVVTADLGQIYRDFTNGALYFFNGTNGTNTGWAIGVGVGGVGVNLRGVQLQQSGGPSSLNIYCDGGYHVYISDLLGENGTGNGVEWNSTGIDGQQTFKIFLGSTGQYTTSFNADGTTQIPGALVVPIVTKTATYAMTVADQVVLANGTFTVTLPDPTVHAGETHTVKNTGSGTVTVAPHAAETIDGHSTISLATQYEGVTVASDGTNWFVIGQVATSIL
jgi:hypothetical protein